MLFCSGNGSSIAGDVLTGQTCTFHQSHDYDRSFQSWILDFLALAWKCFKEAHVQPYFHCFLEQPCHYRLACYRPDSDGSGICIKQKIGMLIVRPAMFNDLVGWLIFFYLPSGRIKVSGPISALIFCIFWFWNSYVNNWKENIEPYITVHTNKVQLAGGVLSIGLGFVFPCRGLHWKYRDSCHSWRSSWGLLLEDSVHPHERAREIIHQFVTNIFAPYLWKYRIVCKFHRNISIWVWLPLSPYLPVSER